MRRALCVSRRKQGAVKRLITEYSANINDPPMQNNLQKAKLSKPFCMGVSFYLKIHKLQGVLQRRSILRKPDPD